MESVEEHTEHIRGYPELVLWIDSSCLSLGGAPSDAILSNSVGVGWMHSILMDEVFASWECFPSPQARKIAP